MVMVGSCGLTRITAFLAPLIGSREGAVRQRLREWYRDKGESGRREPHGSRPPTPPDVLIVSGGFLYGCNSAYLSERLTRP